VKVFISWSGEQSKQIALALRRWLPQVVQAIEPYMSDADNEAGTLWDHVLTAELDSTNFGILCLTPNNLKSPWIHFEAGAISKAVTNVKARVIPLLYRLSSTDVEQPLARFHWKMLDKEGIFDTLKTMNNALPQDQRRKEAALIELFEIVWPKLDAELFAVQMEDETPHRDQRALIEETLELVRDLARANGLAIIKGLSPDRMLETLRKIAGPDGIITMTGTDPDVVIEVRSPRLRMDGLYLDADEQLFLEHADKYYRAGGIKLRLKDPDEDYEPDL
jgi:hypothetical protein